MIMGRILHAKIVHIHAKHAQDKPVYHANHLIIDLFLMVNAFVMMDIIMMAQLVAKNVNIRV